MDDRLYKLKELVDKGIDEITSKPALDKDTVCIAGELVDIRKDISTIEAMEDYGYSEGMSDMYDNGVSYGRGGRMGYSRTMYANNGSGRSSYGRGNSYGRGSYNRGYGAGMDDRDNMIMHLEKAMENASNEHERDKIHRMISQIEQG